MLRLTIRVFRYCIPILLLGMMSLSAVAQSADYLLYSVDSASGSLFSPTIGGDDIVEDLFRPTGPAVVLTGGSSAVPLPLQIEVDAISNLVYGFSIRPSNISVSVDRSSVGAMGSDVYAESTLAPSPQVARALFHADFRSATPNTLFLLANGDDLPANTNIDGIVGPSYSDYDFFWSVDHATTLDATSPYFGTSPADIWISRFESGYSAQPTLKLSASDLGLITPTQTEPGDDIDALAVAGFDVRDRLIAMYFSLAPGSPTLELLGASPADILASGFMGNSRETTVYKTAASLGLLETDNINALGGVGFFPEPSSAVLLTLAIGSLICGRHRQCR